MNQLTSEGMLLSVLNRVRELDTSTYSVRRSELERLHSHASSDTCRDLIGRAIEVTDERGPQ